jgi:flagellar hook-length control protein FliK
VTAIDLALLAPALASDASPADAPVAPHKDKGETAGSPDAVAVEPGDKTDSKSDAPTAAPDGKAADFAVSLLVLPPPASPPSVPVQAKPEDAVAGVAPSGANPASIAQLNTPAPAQATAQVEPAPAHLASAAEVSAASTQPTSAASTQPDSSASPQPDSATPLDARAAAKSAGAPPTPGESVSENAAPVAARPDQAETKPSGHPSEPAGKTRSEQKAAQASRADAGKEQSAPHGATKPAQAQAHASADATHPADQAPDQDAKPAHQPHAQPAEHAASVARVAVATAQSDPSTPASVAQAVTAQIGSIPPALGLNQAPLASPLQSFWQAAQRTDSSDGAVPIAGVAVEIVSRVQEGSRRFEIRLDPPELGRIDVRLDVDRGGNVTSRLTVDRAETLDLLRRDAPQLERALQHAGLNTEGGLQFSLRDQNFAGREQTTRDSITPTLIIPDEDPAAAEALRRGYGRLIGLGGGVDIRV